MISIYCYNTFTLLLTLLNSGAKEEATLLSRTPTSPSLGGFADSLGSRLFVRLMKHSSSYTLTCFIAVHTKVAVSYVILEPACVSPQGKQQIEQILEILTEAHNNAGGFPPPLFFSTIWCLLPQCQGQNRGRGSGGEEEKHMHVD